MTGLERPVDDDYRVTGLERPVDDGYRVTGLERPVDDGYRVTGLERPVDDGYRVTGLERPVDDGYALARPGTCRCQASQRRRSGCPRCQSWGDPGRAGEKPGQRAAAKPGKSGRQQFEAHRASPRPGI